MPELTMGANAPITDDRGDLLLEWPEAAGSLDCSAFLLAAGGRVRADSDMIFYNQREGGNGAVRLVSSEHARDHARFALDLQSTPPEIERIVVCATIDRGGPTMAAFAGFTASFGGTSAAIRFLPDLRGAGETALRVVEIYRRGSGWKLRADGQGYNAGLGPLAASFGVDVEGSEPPDAIPVSPSPAVDDRGVDRDAEGRRVEDERTFVFDVPPPDAADAPQAVGRPSGTRLLERGATRTLTLPDGRAGDVMVAVLSWSSRQGGAEGRARPLRPNLGAFYEMRDGRRGAIQEPDARQGPPGDEILKLASCDGGGRASISADAGRLQEMALLHLYAFLDGPPSWHASRLELLVTARGDAPVVIEVSGADDGCSCILLAALRIDGRDMTLEHIVRGVADQRALDVELGWGLEWKAPDRR